MPPNLEEQFSDGELTNGDDVISTLDSTTTEFSLPALNWEEFHPNNSEIIFLPDELHLIPLDQNLRELLFRVTNTEELSSVTQVKLRVISREVTLQYLSIYTPSLRELILDGSLVSSLRDLGSGLKNLKILKVNRCGLVCIDGVFGFENLEELYAADNAVKCLTACAFLNNVKVIDIRRNRIQQDEIGYLSLCDKLEELDLEGNFDIENLSEFKLRLSKMLPNLKILNGYIIPNDTAGNNVNISEPSRHQLNGDDDRSHGFSINFPPRIHF